MANHPVINLLRSLGLGLLLIGAAAGVLLYSDLDSRNRDKATTQDIRRPLRVALVQFSSIKPIEDGVWGALTALEERGYVDGERLALRRYNSESDMATANSIATEVTSEDFDLIITISTPSLQTVANANRNATPPRLHVFGLSSDPYRAVSISRDNHLEHPPYMTGYGSMPPVEDGFRMLRMIRPEVSRVGLVWNPAEANSVAATEIARKICAELGIELIEANADTSLVAGEATSSVLSRGVDALWISGDITTITAADVLIGLAKRTRVPVFTSIPGNADKGALFDVGADYYAIGFQEGQLAADVLEGLDPATVPVDNIMPVELHVNLTALEGLRDPWQVPEDVQQEAKVLIDASGRQVRTEVAGAPPPATAEPVPAPHKPTVDMIQYVDTPNADVSRDGIMDGLAKAGLEPGRDFELRRHSAQGDIATLSSIIDSVVTQRSDLIITLSTPALQNAMKRGRETPLVFAMVSNPFIVHAGTTDADHLPFLTGAYLDQPLDEVVRAIRLVMPEARRLGTLYTPVEINSEFNMSALERVALAAGYEFEKIGINTVGDVPEAGIALAARNLDVWTQVADNLIASGVPAIMESSRRAKLPVITFSPAAADFGAMIVIARDYYDTGVESGLLAARVLNGEDPAGIPFATSSSMTYVINLKTAKDFGIEIPQELLDKASRIIR